MSVPVSSSEQGSAMWSRWRVRLGYPVALVYALLARPTPRTILIGAGIALLGLLIRGAAAGHLYKHQKLAVSGPYRFTRNPLYFGSALLAAGFLVAGRSWQAASLVAVYFAVFYSAVMRREEEELRSRYGAAFEEYAARVSLVLPSLMPGIPAEGEAAAKFSWAQYRKNREYQAALGTVLAFVLLFLRFLWLG